MSPVLFEESALAAPRRACERFLRNRRGVTEDKTGHDRCPARESIREIVVRLLNGGVAGAESLRSGLPPVYEEFETPTGSLRELLRTLAEAHEALLAGRDRHLAGQVAALRPAADPCRADRRAVDED